MANSVRVRIAVLVNQAGEWIAYGKCGESDAVALSFNNECAGWSPEEARERVYFVEATLELPTLDAPATVEGSVADAG